MSVAPLQLLKSEFNPLVYVFLDNATDKLVSGAFYYGATTTTPTDAYFTKGAILVQATDGVIYINTAADGVTPTWNSVGNIAPSEITLADGKVLIGGVSGLAAAQTISGDITITNAGVSAIGADKVLKAMLAPSVRATYMDMFLDDSYTTVGGAAAEVIAVAGVLPTDKVIVSLYDAGTNTVSIVSAVAGTDDITVTFSADPGNDAVIAYIVKRATA